MEINLDTIHIVHVVLTEPEAREAIADPQPLQGAIRIALHRANGNGHKPQSRKPAKSRSTNRRAPKVHTLSCDQCIYTTTSARRLENHIRRRHPQVNP